MSKGFEIRGIVVPVLTPLNADHEVDAPSLRRLVRFVLDAGVDGLWVLGAVGQFHTLTERQRDVVMETALEAADGRVPVLIGCIDTSPDRAIERGHRAKAAGADAIFATAPIFDAVTQTEILATYRRIREAVDLPLVAYNAQYATQTPFRFETVRTLAEEGTLAGIKHSADFAEFRRLVVELADLPDFRVVTGHAGLADSALAMGAHGCVATYANVVPAVYSSIYRAARDGDWAAARAHQDYAVRAERLVNAWGPGSVFGSFLGATKTALREMGVLSSAVVGRPYPDPTESQVARVREAMASLGLSHVSPATLAK